MTHPHLSCDHKHCGKILRNGVWYCNSCGFPIETYDVPLNLIKERGLKNDFSKPQMSLLPLKDLEGVVRVLEFGMKKYARGDWKFVPDGGMRYFDAGLRHLGELTDPDKPEDFRKLDPESALPHIDHAICSLIFARHFIFKEVKDNE